MNLPRKLLLPALALLLSSGAANAHQIWLEQNGDGASLYFGEFAKNLHEESPGLLDKLAQPKARLLKGETERPLTLAKKSAEYRLAGRAVTGEELVVEDNDYPVREAHGELGLTGRMLWRPAARYAPDFAAQAPKLALDIVPAGEPGTFKVYWNGEPSPAAKIEAIAESGWSREFKTDDAGVARIPLPWRGRYVLLSHHTERLAGDHPDQPYDFITHTTTLSFATRSGDASPPTPPPAPANHPH